MGLVAEHLPIPRWRGLRVVVADGSAVRLTMMKDNCRRRPESGLNLTI